MEVEKDTGKDAPRFVVKKWCAGQLPPCSFWLLQPSLCGCRNAVTFWSWDICTGALAAGPRGVGARLGAALIPFAMPRRRCRLLESDGVKLQTTATGACWKAGQGWGDGVTSRPTRLGASVDASTHAYLPLLQTRAPSAETSCMSLPSRRKPVRASLGLACLRFSEGWPGGDPGHCCA